jgi:hypothetical protein
MRRKRLPRSSSRSQNKRDVSSLYKIYDIVSGLLYLDAVHRQRRGFDTVRIKKGSCCAWVDATCPNHEHECRSKFRSAEYPTFYLPRRTSRFKMPSGQPRPPGG